MELQLNPQRVFTVETIRDDIVLRKTFSPHFDPSSSPEHDNSKPLGHLRNFLHEPCTGGESAMVTLL